MLTTLQETVVGALVELCRSTGLKAGGARMKLMINGEMREHKGDGRLESVLAETGADRTRVAVMLDGRVVPREEQGSVTLREGARLELLTFAGGG